MQVVIDVGADAFDAVCCGVGFGLEEVLLVEQDGEAAIEAVGDAEGVQGSVLALEFVDELAEAEKDAVKFDVAGA